MNIGTAIVVAGICGFACTACSKQPLVANIAPLDGLGTGNGGDVLGTSFIFMDGLGIVNDDPSREEGRDATFGQGVGGGGGITMPDEVACDASVAGGWMTFARGAGFTGIFVHIFGF